MQKLFLLVLILMTACKPRSELKGIWRFGDETLIDFSEDSVSFVSIGSQERGKLDTVIVQSKRYMRRDSRITIYSDDGTFELHLLSINKDSLSFSITGESEVMVAKKLEHPLGGKVVKADLAGKGFELMIGQYSSKLDFIDDSLVFSGGYHRADKWTITTYKGFDFLNTTVWFLPKVPIYKKGEEIVASIDEGKEPAEFKVEKQVRGASDLLGNWIEYERQPRLPLFSNTDTLQSLQITSDSIRIKRFDRSRQYPLNMSFDGTIIHFANSGRKNWNLRTPMEILELTDDTLIIEEWGSIGDSTIIKYKADDRR